MESKDSYLPIEKFLHGNFYQVQEGDAKRIASRIFQIYDKDADKFISIKEVRYILNDIYKGIDAPPITKQDQQEYLDILNKTNSKKVIEEDFVQSVTNYFVNTKKQGSLDKQNLDPELYELNKAADLNLTGKELKRKLEKEAVRRFGKDFVNYQLKKCKQLFDENTDGDDNLEFKEIFNIFEHIFKKINYLNKREKLEKEDLERLLLLINYEEDGKISYAEFEIYYFKALLGS